MVAWNQVNNQIGRHRLVPQVLIDESRHPAAAEVNEGSDLNSQNSGSVPRDVVAGRALKVGGPGFSEADSA
jgi:hypothetical protein